MLRKIEINDSMLFFCKITSHLAITQGGVTLIQPLQYATETSQKDIFIFYAMIVTTKMYPNFTFDRKLSLMTQNCPYMTENYFADIHSLLSMLHL